MEPVATMIPFGILEVVGGLLTILFGTTRLTRGNCQMSWTGDSQAAGCFLTPSTKTVPLTTSGRSVEPFNVRHLFDADSISL
jgi:hypothetical protein